MKNNLDKIIEAAKKAGLSLEEKASIRSFLLEEISKKTVPTPSPFWTLVYVRKYHYVPAFMLAFILLGGGTSFFAQSSLPGDSLYSMKINVNEKVESLLAMSSEDLAEVSAVQANRRIYEAEILAQNDLLTPEKNIEIQNSFSKKFDFVNATLAKIETENAEKNSKTTLMVTSDSSVSSKSRVEQIRNKFEIDLDDHEELLEKISKKSSTSPAKNILSFLKNKRGKGDSLMFTTTATVKSDDSDNSSEDNEESNLKKDDSHDDGDDDSDEDEDEDDDDNRSINPNPPIVTPTSTSSSATSTPTVTSYTLVQVALHKSSTDCWSVISGGVYNLTPWIAQHPGGQAAIMGLCGIDGTSAFLAQHGGQGDPTKQLVTFKIGVLK